MPILSSDIYRQLIAQTLQQAPPVQPAGVVICLCAEWCGVCREFKALFEQLRQAHPELAFRWLDVEDEADLLGDLDIETFPTLVISEGQTLRFAGPVVPQAAQLERLLRSVPA